MSRGDEFVLTLFTNDPVLAAQADRAGINRIGLDLEKIGKAARQDRGKNWISDHEEHQLSSIRKALKHAEFFVRTNPVHSGLPDEIDRLVAAGAEVLMLPMFRTVQEAAFFIERIHGRTKVSLLVETAAAAEQIEEIVRLGGIDEIHVGLNDLHLDLGLKNHFELLGSPLMNSLSEAVRNAGIPFGFGGVGRAGDTALPVSPDLIYAQYPRLGADRALVSRVFTAPDYTALDLPAEVAAFRKRMNQWYEKPETELAGMLRALQKQAVV